MANLIILTTIGDSSDADRILHEFEGRTGLQGDRRSDGRYFEMRDEEHRTEVVQTLTDIDERWTDHVGLKDPS